MISHPEDLTSQPPNRANPGTISRGGVDLRTVLLLEAALPRPSGDRWGIEGKMLYPQEQAGGHFPSHPQALPPHGSSALHGRVETQSVAWLLLTSPAGQASGQYCLDHHTASMFTDRGAQFSINSSCFYKKREKFKLLIICTENGEDDSSPLSKTLIYLQGRGMRQRRPSLGCHPDLWGSSYSLKSQVSMGRHGVVSGPMMETARAPRMVLSGTAPQYTFPRIASLLTDTNNGTSTHSIRAQQWCKRPSFLLFSVPLPRIKPRPSFLYGLGFVCSPTYNQCHTELHIW